MLLGIHVSLKPFTINLHRIKPLLIHKDTTGKATVPKSLLGEVIKGKVVSEVIHMIS